jgi:hypothetical protein
MAAIVSADQTEWLTVAGIGPERARSLYEPFNLRRSSPTAADDRSRPLKSGEPPGVTRPVLAEGILTTVGQ